MIQRRFVKILGHCITGYSQKTPLSGLDLLLLLIRYVSSKDTFSVFASDFCSLPVYVMYHGMFVIMLIGKEADTEIHFFRIRHHTFG